MMSDPDSYMEHVLARDLGMTVDRLRAEMTCAEFVEHAAFYKAREAKHGG